MYRIERRRCQCAILAIMGVVFAFMSFHKSGSPRIGTPLAQYMPASTNLTISLMKMLQYETQIISKFSVNPTSTAKQSTVTGKSNRPDLVAPKESLEPNHSAMLPHDDQNASEYKTAPTTPLQKQNTNRTLPSTGHQLDDKVLIITNGTVNRFKGQETFNSTTCPNLSPNMTCEYILTTPQSSYTSHAVIFKPFHLKYINGTIRRKHPPHQKWIFHEWEAPCRTWTNQSYNQDIWTQMNLTMGYSKDADIFYYQYGHKCRPNPDWKPSLKDYASEKNGSILWIVSNCNDTTGREIYVRELKKYIQVDIGGRCVNTSICGGRPGMFSDCIGSLFRQYKFYLAFENSFCEEYYTEKVWRALQYDTVPVVMGIVNYTQLVPGHSFIDVRDFKSPKDLADRLRYLSNNDTAYNEYVEAKNKVICEKTSPRHPLCDVCYYLHMHKHELQTVKDVREYWSIQKMCKTPTEFFTGIADSILPKLPQPLSPNFWH